MMSFDDDGEELFEGRIEISNLERGSTFGLDEETYYRMARCAMNAAGMGIEPSVICSLPSGERGCKLDPVWEDASIHDPGPRPARCTIHRRLRGATRRADLLDSALLGMGLRPHWSRALRSMLAVEGVAYYDSHWAAEQQGDGDGDVEA